MTKKVLWVAALIFIASAIATVGVRLVSADWGAGIDMNELRKVNSRIAFPFNQTQTEEWKLQKLTFAGFVRSARLQASVEGVRSYTYILAKSNGWEEKSKSVGGGRERMIFCDKNIAHDIEIVPIDSEETYIRYGSYWAADRRDSRFCRAK